MTKHGGARPGAGRPHLNGSKPGEGELVVTVTISIPRAMRDKLRDLGNGNVSEGVRRAVAITSEFNRFTTTHEREN